MKTSTRKAFFGACLVMALFTTTTPRASGDTIAYTTSGTETDLGGYGLSAFEFTVTQNISLTQLGFTALSLGGGDQPHVTLWNATSGLGSLSQIYDTGNILSSVTSTGQGTGTGAPSFVSVGTPISLVVGQTYLISAPAYWVSTFDSSGITTAGSVFGSTAFLKGGGWVDWNNSSYNFSALSAAPTSQIPTTVNFQYTVAAVPEPSTYVLVGAGLAMLLVALRRRTGGLLR